MNYKKYNKLPKKVILGEKIVINEVVAVARYKAKVEFSKKFKLRVNKSRSLVDKWINEERVIYGVTTGFGSLCDQIISKEESKKLQKNIILSHATSVGKPLEEEEVRSIILMMLLNMGQGYSGVTLNLLERLKLLLNMNIIPYVPKEGSVGYLSLEAHIGLVLIGKGKAFYKGKLLKSSKIYDLLGIKALELEAKEGLSLISGTTSPTGLAALALYDMINAAKNADIIATMSFEVLKGTTKAFDENLMEVRNYEEQKNTAYNIRKILETSLRSKENEDYRLQDALSLRAIPQLHGASKKTLIDALDSLEKEINSCNDNPIIWQDSNFSNAISGCNCDASYIGLEMDSACIASTMIAKMSERRNSRLLNGNISGFSSFLVKNPGVNSGLMIPQYTQAGLLNDMKILSHPASVDSIPTSNGQEDYVSMGYNSAKKSIQVVDKLQYILAIELLSVYQSYQFISDSNKVSKVSKKIYEKLNNFIPIIEEDIELSPHISKIKELISSNIFINITESLIGGLK